MTLPSVVLSIGLAGIVTMTYSLMAEGAPSVTGPAPSGIITGLAGSPSAAGKAASGPRHLSLGDMISTEQEVRTRQDDSVEILWSQRALIQVQPHTSVTIEEKKEGQVTLRLSAGRIRVALAYDGPATDIVTVQTPTGRIFTRGGIMEVDVLSPRPSLFSRVSTALSGGDTPPAALIETVRVREGQSGVEALGGSTKSEMLEAGAEARVASGVIQQVSNLPATADRGLGLASTDRRQSTPPELARRIARVHVDHALEVERLTQAAGPPLDGKEVTTGPDLKGTIVATSLGVPAGTLSGPAMTGSGSPGPSGPTLSPVQSPTVTTLGTNQSGGLNSKSILNEVLSDHKGRGSKEKGKGR